MKNYFRYFILTLALLLTIIPSAQAELACEPLILAGKKESIPDRHARGMLWKIQHTGLKPSYLFGTMHLSDKEITTLPRTVLEVLDNAFSVTLEAIVNDNSIRKMFTVMYYQDGSELEQKTGTELYRQTAQLLSRYGLPGEIIRHIKPWAAYLTLGLPASQKGLPLDMVIMNRGKRFGAKTFGLETVEEQLGVLDGLALDKQIQLLKQTVCHYDKLQDDIQEMKQLYLNRDLAGLVGISEKYESAPDQSYDALMTELITNRNKKMHTRMQDRLQEGNAFIAVGALHLPGEEGILGLLEKQGFIVTPIY